jgi:hypothetical protein
MIDEAEVIADSETGTSLKATRELNHRASFVPHLDTSDLRQLLRLSDGLIIIVALHHDRSLGDRAVALEIV